MLCPHPHPVSDQGSRDGVQTGTALATVELGSAEALLASSGVTGEEPHLWAVPGPLWKETRVFCCLGSQGCCSAPSWQYYSTWTSALPLTSWPAVARGTGVLASVHGFSHLCFGDGSVCLSLSNGSLNVVFFPFSQAISKSKLRSVLSFHFYPPPSILRACVGLSMLRFKFSLLHRVNWSRLEFKNVFQIPFKVLPSCLGETGQGSQSV